jgi:protein TonB
MALSIHRIILGLIVTSAFWVSDVNAQETPNRQADTTEEKFEPVRQEVREEAGPRVYSVVEQMPEFPGGDSALYKYLSDNLVYPDSARVNGVSGKVFVHFIIDEKGKVVDAKVIKGIGWGCDEEALRLVRKMPDWKPGKQNGRPVQVRFTLPIRFQLP